MREVKRIYLCGPMTGIAEFNYPEFNAVAELLQRAGYSVANPAANLAPPCGTYVGWIRQAIAQLVSCYGLAYLDGWEASRGAHIEIRIARDIEIPIMGWREWRRRAPDLLSLFTP